MTEFIAVSIESEDLHGGDIPRVRLGGTQMWPDDANGCECGMDVSRGLMDGSGAQMDAPNMSSRAEMAIMKHRDEVGTYLGARDVKHVIEVMDGIGSHVDMSSGHRNILSIETHAIKPENETANVRLPCKKVKPPDIPIGPARVAPNEPDGCGNLADMSSMCTDMHSIGNKLETSVNETDIVRTHQVGQRTQNLPYIPKNGMPKHAICWRRVNVDEINVYLPWNAPVQALGQMFIFGRFKSGDEQIAANVESERAEDGDGDQNGGAGDDRGNGDVDGTTSGGGVHLIRVNAALLAGKS